MRRVFVTLVPIAGLACGGGDHSAPALHSDAGTADVLLDGAFQLDAADGGIACKALGRSIFAIANDGRLLAVEPETRAVRTLGTPGCTKAQPFAMTVDRGGTAWVFYLGGSVFRVDLSTLSCAATPYVADAFGWSTLSMAFVGDPTSVSGERLYATGLSFVGAAKPPGLATVDPTSMRFDYLAAFADGAEPGDLTGAADGRLFSFVYGAPPKLVELDRATAKAKSSVSLPGVTIGTGWAFAHWGGALYLFSAPKGTSRVDRYDLETGALTPVVADLGAIVVGAGVSTCAPSETIR